MSGTLALTQLERDVTTLRIMLATLTGNVSQNQAELVADISAVMQAIQQQSTGPDPGLGAVTDLLNTVVANQTAATAVLEKILVAIKLLPMSPVAITLDTEDATRKPQPIPGRPGLPEEI